MYSNILSNVVLVNLDFHIFTGRRKLREEDIEATKLPPEELASLGSKKTIDPKDLAPFSRVKRNCERLLDKHGVRFLGGWAVPTAKIDRIARLLGKYKDEFYTERKRFIAEYDELVDKWILKHTEFEASIRKAVVPADHVESRLQAGFQVAKVGPSGEEKLDTGIIEATEGLAGKLFQDIADQAADLWEKSIKGRSQITWKTLRPLRTMIEKLDGLTFLDARVTPVSSWIKRTLKALPEQGETIRDNDLAAVSAVVLILGDSAKLQAHGKALLDEGNTEAPDLFGDNETFVWNTLDLDAPAAVPEEKETAIPEAPAPVNTAESPATAQDVPLAPPATTLAPQPFGETEPEPDPVPHVVAEPETKMPPAPVATAETIGTPAATTAEASAAAVAPVNGRGRKKAKKVAFLPPLALELETPKVAPVQEKAPIMPPPVVSATQGTLMEALDW